MALNRVLESNFEHLFTITLEKPLSNNNNGQSRHWSSSHQAKRQWMMALKDASIETEMGYELDLEHFTQMVLMNEPLAEKVGIVVVRVLGKGQRFMDSDSVCRGDCKQLIDSVVDCGILADDSKKHVDWVIGTEDDTRRSDGPLTLVQFYSAVAKD